MTFKIKYSFLTNIEERKEIVLIQSSTSTYDRSTFSRCRIIMRKGVQSTNLLLLFRVAAAAAVVVVGRVVREFLLRILSRTYRKPPFVCPFSLSSFCSTPPNDARFLTLIVRDLFDEWNDINDERRYNEEFRCSGWFSILIVGVEFRCDFKCSCHQRYNFIQLSVADIFFFSREETKR